MNWRFCVTASHRAAIANKETNRIGALSSLFFSFSSFFFSFSLSLYFFFFLLFSLSLAATAGVPRARVFPFSRLERSAATRDKANGVDTYYWVRDIQGYIYIFRGCICSYPARGPKSILPHKLSPQAVAVVASPSCMSRATRRGTFAVNETTSLFSERTLEKSTCFFKLRFYSRSSPGQSRSPGDFYAAYLRCDLLSLGCRNALTRLHFYSREYSRSGGYRTTDIRVAFPTGYYSRAYVA